MAGSKTIVELDTDMFDERECGEVFRSTGRAGNILLIKAEKVLPRNIVVMIHSYYKSSSEGLMPGLLPQDNGSASSNDVAAQGFKYLLWMTPQVFEGIHGFFKREVFCAKQTFCFPFDDPDKQDWSIFD
jgi:hypothetical protein